jgi:hypothetical protein
MPFTSMTHSADVVGNILGAADRGDTDVGLWNATSMRSIDERQKADIAIGAIFHCSLV